MNYPRTTVSVALYNQGNPELEKLARQFVKVAEPKKARIAFKVATAFFAATIIGLPIAYLISNYRKEKMRDDQDVVFGKLKDIRSMQVRHHIREEINIHWQGNASPHIGFNGDTALVYRAMRGNPNFLRFNLEELRAGRDGTPGVEVSLAERAKPQPPSYGALFAQEPPPNYYELTRN